MAQLQTLATNNETPPPPPRSLRNPNGSTGPKTEAGKAIVAGNAITSGCNICYRIENGRLTEDSLQKLILPGESEADWNALHERWIADYQPDTPSADALVLQVALAEWGWGRATRRYNELEQVFTKEQDDVLQWTPAQYTQLDRFLRYQTRGERSYYRARGILEAWRREARRDTEKAATAETRAAGKSATPAANKTDKTQGPTRPAGPQAALIQCITVQVVDGETRTLFQPANQNFAGILHAMASSYQVVKRAIYFTCDPPPEYHWLAEGAAPKLPFHVVLERTPEQALADLERELRANSPHVLAIPEA